MVLAVEHIAENIEDSGLSDMFAGARALHANFYHGFMEEYEFEIDREKVLRFVNRMLELSG